MINKVFKTILILMICLGLTIPTNAAVSVSDGSAFVTKAEFAADLNNLSNRMAQLENSLDAKIDSLVSSYLTRNGIWNGAKQDLLFSYFDCESPISQAFDYDAYTVNVLGSKHNLFKANKSGLCFMEYDWYSTRGAAASAFWGYAGIGRKNGYYKNLPDDSLVLTLYFLNDSDDVLTVQTLTSAKSIPQGWNNADALQNSFYLAAALPPSRCRVINNFFVVKDENYYIQFRAFVNVGFSNNSVPSSVNQGGLRIVLSAANIY